MKAKLGEYIHVYPLNDLREHELEGVDCWCNPRIEDDWVVVHNAMDQRERCEQRGDCDAG